MEKNECFWKPFDEKWRAEWEKAGVYSADPDRREKKFITAAFPYPNSPQHIGHGRTYTVADVYARYLRMRGFNVLFPMGFHVTGTPILSMAKKIREKDAEMLDIFERIYGINRAQAAKLAEPRDLVMYFSREIEQGMKEMGYAIDWRRKFYTFDPHFNKFIEWQFAKLKELGYLKTGEHPVPWCPADNNAVSAHDTRGDIDPEIKEFTAIKFAYEDGYILTATLRPETIYGVTNLWVNPDADCVKAKSGRDGETYYVSRRAAEKMGMQGFELAIVEGFKGSKLVGRKAKNPVTGEEVPIYRAEYVKDDTGTGMVMSVPSHAPYDHIALLDLGIHLDYKQVVKVEGYGFMAQELIEQRGVKDQHDPRLEEIVKEVYRKEILTGRMVAGPYAGEKVSVAIEKTKADLAARKLAVAFREIDKVDGKHVHCRCGAEIMVKIVANQWFIDYGDLEWKKKAKECLAQMRLMPERTREEYLYVVDWLKEKACVRSRGLGTPFPFEKSQIIESLSDSTIYMAFYTIAHMLGDVKAGEMDEKFFDYVLLGKGAGSAKAKRMRESFLYWYPLDSRHSGADLIRNHLPFFVFNHAAIFERKLWPKQIVANGFVLMDGKKMSKSMGNILPLRGAVAEYGADVVRLGILGGADLSVDSDFSRTVAQGVDSRLRMIFGLAEHAKHPARERIDFWLLSRLNKRLEKIGGKFEDFQYREMIKELLYDTSADISWYLRRCPAPRMKEFFDRWSRAIAPFAPHVAEELWHRIGNKTFVVNEKLPVYEKKLADEKLGMQEELLARVMEDVEKISKLTSLKARKASIIIANDWKRNAYGIAREERSFDKAIKKCMESPGIKKHGAEAAAFLKHIGKNIFALPQIMERGDEAAILSEGKPFMEKNLGIEIEIFSEEDSKHPKAKNAMPGKPAIVLE
ncbi:MAG: leucine--tRNA ligase [Candidatus ainarchaeum sp.]|nr:leucine--tRNA ligase [Candidatus ainarchaeum sp.]